MSGLFNHLLFVGQETVELEWILEVKLFKA
jgi:hypothetical protein